MDTHLFLFGGGSPFTDGFASKFAKISLTLGGPVSILLTHEEICAGVITAIQTGKDHTIVGQLEPWEMRP
ncbi:hypothetical protein [Caldifermentibacillus hisashii]|uniref:hypothetical protein n=1 Tax=Caldifermentibacillus hisashii TaxID=996558 RepID=UPI003D15A04F